MLPKTFLVLYLLLLSTSSIPLGMAARDIAKEGKGSISYGALQPPRPARAPSPRGCKKNYGCHGGGGPPVP